MLALTERSCHAENSCEIGMHRKIVFNIQLSHGLALVQDNRSLASASWIGVLIDRMITVCEIYICGRRFTSDKMNLESHHTTVIHLV